MILAVIFLGLFLRLISLNQSFWIDEATSVLTARDLSFSEIITKFSPGDFHPPLYYILLKVWQAFFGTGEVGVRLLSVLAGVATIYIVFLIGNYLLGRKVAIIASVFLATSPLHIYYSQEARMYALSTLFVVLSVYFFLNLQKSHSLLNWLAFSLSLPLIIFTDYVSAFIIPVFWVLGKAKKRIPLKRLLLAHIPLILAILAWLPILRSQLLSGLSLKTTFPGWWSILGGISIKEVFLVPVKFMLGRISFVNKKLYALAISLAGLIFGLLMVKATQLHKKLRIVWFWLLAPILICILVSLKIPVFYYFRFIFILPAFYLILASGVTRLRLPWKTLAIGLVIGINLSASLAYLANSRFHREDWRSLVNFVDTHSTKNSIVIFVADSQMEAYNYYSKTKNFSGPNGLNDSFKTVCLMRYVQSIFDPDDILRQSVEKFGYVKNGEFDFNSVVVWRYVR